MHTTNYKKFKGEIENYVTKGKNIFESRIDRTFRMLNVKTHLNHTKIRKKDGYHAAHLLFMLTLLPMLKIKTVHSFCQKRWYHWCIARKDAFYRFKQTDARWRSFMYKVMIMISEKLNFEKFPLQERYLVIDDSAMPKRGKNIENVSFIYDHNLGRIVLGFCVVSLGLFTGQNFYPIDFSYWFSKNRHPQSPEERIGDPRSISGQMSYDAKYLGKPALALKMIQRAFDCGIRAGYVLFDSWYAWPSFIRAIRKINSAVHVVCRLKDTMVQYEYKDKRYRLSELYQKVRSTLKKDSRTGLLLARATVKLPDSHESAVIVFSKGYKEPEDDPIKGKKKSKEPKWIAFLTTNTRLHSSTIIKKYTKRWTTEVCFKECKQLLGLGKDQSIDFNAQVFSTTVNFLQYNLLNFLNEKDNYGTTGNLFQELADESATITYAQRLWDFFRGLFQVAMLEIFDLFKIEEQCSSYINALTEVLSASTPIQGCET
jgi:hypothetical protein